MDNPFLDINRIREQERVKKEIEEKLNAESYRKAYEAGVKAYKFHDDMVKKHLQNLREAYNAREYIYGGYGRMYGRKEGDDIITGHISELGYKPGWKITYIDIGYWRWHYDSQGDEGHVSYYVVSLKYNDSGNLYLECKNRSGHKVECALWEVELVENLKKLYNAT